MTDTITSLADIAHKAVTSPSDLSPSEITRLGASWIDRKEIVASHYEQLREAGSTMVGKPVPDMGVAERPSELQKRLAVSDPTKQVEHAAETEHQS